MEDRPQLHFFRKSSVGMMNLKNIMLVIIGSAVGGTLRYWISGWIQQFNGSKFPAGTFTVNLLGCFLLGMILEASSKSNDAMQMKILLITGFCGGFTTFSAFSLENLDLIRSGNITIAVFYALTSVLMGIFAVWGGIALLK